MLETCPICGHSLRNGTDGPNKIKYPDEWRAQFDAGEITLEELNDHAQVYYERARLCFNISSNVHAPLTFEEMLKEMAVE